MIARVLGAVVLVLLAVIVWQRGTVAKARLDTVEAQHRAEAAEGQAKQLREALAAERAKAAELETVAQKYETEKQDAEQRAEKLAADLRAGNIRLRQRWQAQTCPAGDMPATAATTGITDAAAADRAESAARIVRAAAECDAQVRGLQAVIRADRGE